MQSRETVSSAAAAKAAALFLGYERISAGRGDDIQGRGQVMTENKSFFTGWEAECDICGRCGNCRAECPTYRQTGWESATPRGKMTLLRRAALSQGGEERALLAKRISECTLCGSCTSQCAARIDLQQVWKQVRGELKKQGELPAAYDLLVKNLLDKKNISQFDNAARLD